MTLSDQSISLSTDMMTSIDMVQNLLSEYEQFSDKNEIVKKIVQAQFKENTWQFVENLPTAGYYKNKTQRMFSCSVFDHELYAVATYRNGDSDEMFEYVEYTSKAVVERQKATKQAIQDAIAAVNAKNEAKKA